jgi:hypothetical protein
MTTCSKYPSNSEGNGVDPTSRSTSVNCGWGRRCRGVQCPGYGLLVNADWRRLAVAVTGSSRLAETLRLSPRGPSVASITPMAWPARDKSVVGDPAYTQ